MMQFLQYKHFVLHHFKPTVIATSSEIAELGIPQTVSQLPQISQIVQLRNLNCSLSKFFTTCEICAAL